MSKTTYRRHTDEFEDDEAFENGILKDGKGACVPLHMVDGVVIVAL